MDIVAATDASGRCEVYREGMTVVGHLRRRGGDVVVIALAVWVQLEFWLGSVPEPRFTAVFGLTGTLPLLLRRRFPLVAPLALLSSAVAASFIEVAILAESIGWIAAVIAAGWWIGLLNERNPAIFGGVIGFACAQVLNRNFEGETAAGDVIFTAVLIWAPIVAGQIVRVREQRAAALAAQAERLAEERDERARAAAAEERARIARELHDVVAHSISVMTIQAGAARLLIDDSPLRAAEPLRAVEETGRQTLAEMRRLLGILDHGATPGLSPQPGLSRLTSLLEQVRSAGLAVDLVVEGQTRSLPPGVDLAAYRIVQEALTNTLKHAGPAAALVAIRYLPQAVELEITDDGRGGGGGNGGHGLVGMRERASLYGGTVSAARRPGGGFEVRAVLPLEPR
jgi:signal transduction histidine kinase